MRLESIIAATLLIINPSNGTPIKNGAIETATSLQDPQRKPSNISPRFRSPDIGNRYQMVAYRSLYMLVPSPVYAMVSLYSDIYANEHGGANIYARLLDYATEHWQALTGLDDLRMVIGQFEFRVSTRSGESIPVDFVQWFARSMYAWAINGFFTAYDAFCVVGDGEQLLRVQMRLLVPWESLNLWDDSPMIPP